MVTNSTDAKGNSRKLDYHKRDKCFIQASYLYNMYYDKEQTFMAPISSD